MVKRALVERRPWLLASLVFGVSWWFVAGSAMPGTYQIAWKGAAVGFLAIYAFQRHLGLDGTLTAGVMAFAAMGDMALELVPLVAGILFALSHALAVWLYARHRRPALAPSQKLFALTLVIVVPLLAWLLLLGKADQLVATVYAVFLAAMAAMAWTSRFRRYRVGLGALFFVVSDLLILAGVGEVSDSALLSALSWPFYYLGQLMIVTGIITQLRSERAA